MEIGKIPRWDTTINVKSWAGYKDNVLFSHQQPRDSAFLAAGLDLFLWRLPENGREFLLIGSGEYLRYLPGNIAEDESFALLQAQVSQDLASNWKAGLSVESLYFDQVVDVSVIERTLNVAQVEGLTYTVRPKLRRSLSRGWFAESDFFLTRQEYAAIVDDEWQPGASLTVGRSYGVRSELSLKYEIEERRFDSRTPRTTSGIPLPGASLEFLQHEISANWRQNWGEPRHWRTLTRASYLTSSDHGSGYYDYSRWRISQQLRYEADSWNVRAEVKLTRYEYDFQPADPGDSSPRKKTVLQVNLRGEKKLTQSLKAFCEYEYQRSAANLDVEDYRSNTVFAGVDWEF